MNIAPKVNANWRDSGSPDYYRKMPCWQMIARGVTLALFSPFFPAFFPFLVIGSIFTDWLVAMDLLDVDQILHIDIYVRGWVEVITGSILSYILYCYGPAIVYGLSTYFSRVAPIY